MKLKLQQSDREGSDKENSSSGTPKKSSKKKAVTPIVKKESVTARPPIFGVCTGNKESCPVHCVYLPRPKWSFFWDPEQIEALINGLSPRGIREKELRQYLMDEKESLKNYVKKCPVTKLNKEKTYPETIAAATERRSQRTGGGSTSSSKGQTDPRLGFPVGTSVDTILELQLRDLILETEEKVFHGGLGSLKVNDRSDWRTAIEGRTYLAGTNVLNWGGGKTKHIRDKKIDSESTAPSDGILLFTLSFHIQVIYCYPGFSFNILKFYYLVFSSGKER
jgi:bromodomain adjacent to zinc finger domain protein 1A